MRTKTSRKEDARPSVLILTFAIPLRVTAVASRCLRDRLSDDEIVEIAPTLEIIKDAQRHVAPLSRRPDALGIPAVNCSTARSPPTTSC